MNETTRDQTRRAEGAPGLMGLHDAQVGRLRALVREHGPEKGREVYRLEVLRSTPKCPHGRFPASCSHCHYAANKRK